MTEETLAYDLRQKYAEIVGVHLEKVSESRLNKNYPEYFHSLQDLYTVISHKFKETAIEFEGDKTKKVPRKRYQDFVEEFINLANKNKTAYFGTTNSPQEKAEIEQTLNKIERFLFKIMDESQMFGSRWDGGGL